MTVAEQIENNRRKRAAAGRRDHLFKPGQVGNPNGRPAGIPNQLTTLKRQLLSRTGMMPLDFLIAVYRDKLYEEYDEELASDQKTIIFKPKEGSQKIEVTVQQRITCAVSAAPYMHKKMPVGVEVNANRNAAIISSEKLRSMSTQKLGQLLDMMDELGISVEVEETRTVSAPEEKAE